MFKALFAVVLLLACSAADVTPGIASDFDRDQVKTLQRAMNDAFQSNDRAVIKKLAAPDQTAVTPFSSGVVTIGKALQQLGELKIEIVRSGEMKVIQLGPEVMMVGQEISYSGDVGGNPVPTRVHATGIWTKIDGKWRQKFYQETVLE